MKITMIDLKLVDIQQNKLTVKHKCQNGLVSMVSVVTYIIRVT